MNNENILFIDLETQSGVSIKNILEYVNHPSTRIMCATGKINDTINTWIPKHDGSKEFPPFPINCTWVAHNAYGFDKLIWNRLYPDFKPFKWLDTIPMCRANGLPASLDKACEALKLPRKIEAKDLIKVMSQAKWKGNQWWYPVGNPMIWKKLIEYNINDVIILEQLYNKIAPHFHEYELLEVDQIINERGIHFDKKLVFKILELWDKIQHDAFDYITDITNGELSGVDLRSEQKVKRWLERQGVNINSLNKLTIDEELENVTLDESGKWAICTEVIKARQIVTRGTRGKVERLLEIAAITSSERLQHSLMFHGAHTGRWSGRGLQPHNLARPFNPIILKTLMEQWDDGCDLIVEDLGNKPDDRLTEMIRPIFCAEKGKILLIADYSQVEARCTSWVAQEHRMLQAWKDTTRDPYKEFAALMLGKSVDQVTKHERQTIGKVPVLALGYAMSGRTFEVFAKMQKPKLDLNELGFTGKQVVDKWREQNPETVAFWKEIEAKCIQAIQEPGLIHSWSKGRISYDGHNLYLHLPSKRKIVYRNARIELLVPKFCAILGLTPFTKPTVCYDHPHGRRGILYGGLILQNICEGICRDLLADAMIRCEKAPTNFPVVLHVHDEIVTEITDPYTEFTARDIESECDILTRLIYDIPEWAKGFPFKAEITASTRYMK